MLKMSPDLSKWSEIARSMPAENVVQPTVPLHVLFGEAVDAATFFEKNWKTQVDGKGRVVHVGLDSVGAKSKKEEGRGGRRLTAKTGQEILSLQRAAQEAHSCYLLATNPVTGGDPLERARFLAGEMDAAVRWYLDDDVQDEHDERLARVAAAHANDPHTADALAGALDDYAALAEQYRGGLHGLGGFDAAHIDEARALANELRKKPAQSPVPNDALLLRNKLVTLLMNRMNNVRAAARFVYRDQPDIVRRATSAYERKRRAAWRKSKKATAAPAEPAPAVG